MRTRNTLLAAAALAAIAAGSANAAVSVVNVEVGNIQGPAYLNGHTTIANFDDPIAAGFAFTADVPGQTYVRDGSLGLAPGQSAPPPTGSGVYEDTNYYTVTSNGGPHSASLTVLSGWLSAFSFYLGSPDTYNTISFYSGASQIGSLSGSAIWAAANGANGNQTWGRRVYYDFGSDQVTQITFASSGNSFEFDGLAGVRGLVPQGGIPEPSTWAMMLIGFFGAGAMLRSSRRRQVAATA